MPLHELGWSSGFEPSFAPHRDRGCVPARVAREDRGRYLVLGDFGEAAAEVSGRFRHAARGRAEYPAVGDWVALKGEPCAGAATIVAVLPRASAFVRQAAGETTEAQVVAANVDTILVVAGLDADFNVRRIERYLAAAWESGAQPVVVLNKADLADDPDALIGAVQAVAPGVPVVAVSARDGRGLGALSAWVAPGTTVALLGSSGVGKSTLVNALLGAERQETGEVRAGDRRGRHTTTARELIAMPGGALLLDTPGMRELHLWSGEASLGAFPEIDAMAERCRFRDCAHASEPGCAVQEALARGALDPGRLASWQKLRRELEWQAIRQDQRALAERQARWKAISKSMKHHPKAGRWRTP